MDATSVRSRSNRRRHPQSPSSSLISSTSDDIRPNVRVELVEAVIRNDARGKKKKIGDGDGNRIGAGNDDGPTRFDVGVRSVMVLPRTTTVGELLKKSRARLKMRGNPMRAFFFMRDVEGGREVEVDRDLMTVEDGTVLYVSSTPRAARTNGKRVDGIDDDDDGDGVGDDDRENDNDDDKIPIVDPLESAKRVYRRQEGGMRGRRRYPRGRPEGTHVDEVVDADRRLYHVAARSNLPISSHKEQILRAVRDSGVVVITGSTGSGKSTQVPQFLLEEEEEKREREREREKEKTDPRSERRCRRPYIVVTEPRRVAAISLAHRVAEERGCPPPGVGSSVGYMVRNDRRVCFRSCRIIYMTIGILLRMLVSNHGMAGDVDVSWRIRCRPSVLNGYDISSHH